MLSVKPVIVGLSFGGHVALTLATKMSDCMAGLILCETDAFFNLDNLCNGFYELAAASETADPDKIKAIVKDVFTTPSVETMNNYATQAVPLCGNGGYVPADYEQVIPHLSTTQHYHRNELLQFDLRKQLPNISCPVLVLTGDQNPVHSLKSANETYRLLPQNLRHIKYFPDTTTPIYNKHGAEVIDAVNEFLTMVYLQKQKSPDHNHSKLRSKL